MSAEYLEYGEKRLFTVSLQPVGEAPRASILFLHPFAEEMHKSRRTVAMQARILAKSGFNVMLLDLSGCGDSSGSFVECSWKSWLKDAEFAANYLATRWGVPVILWGLRLGALLACELSQQITSAQQLLLWQPALNGEQHIDQFLRTESASMALKGQSGFDRTALWNELRAGRTLNVAGYELSPQLTSEISKIRLHDLTPGCPAIWLDIGKPAGQIPNPACQNVLSSWQQQEVQVTFKSVSGEFFWRNMDAGDSPELLTVTRDVLSSV